MIDQADMLPLLERAARAAPQDPAALGNLAIWLTQLDRLDEAETLFRRALAIAPAVSLYRYSLGLNLLAQGRYAEAWPYYAARIEVMPEGVFSHRKPPFPRWSGEPVQGKRLLVMPEQGLGDQIQFSRFLPELAATGAHVILASHLPLSGLFRSSFPRIEHVVARRVSELPEADYWISLVDLAAALGADLLRLPQPPYIRTEAQWRNPPPGFKVGLMTAGSPRHSNDARRSLSADTAAQLCARLPGRIVTLDPEITKAPSLAETASIIDAVDLVISVDTAAAHLAGAMGKRCLLLLPGFNTDWRWLSARSDSPWYPGHSLYRATVDGDWTEAIDRLVADAQALAR